MTEKGLCHILCRMTGVGGRPELIIEGSNTSNEDDWKVLLCSLFDACDIFCQ